MSADAFRAVTWNLEYTTKPRELRPILRHVLDQNVTVLLLQEITQAAVRRMFREEGLSLSWVAPRYAVAWSPELWTAEHALSVDLDGSLSYVRRGGAAVNTKGAAVRLKGRQGRTLLALSYQLPSSVQREDPLPGRLQVTRAAIGTMSRLARGTDADACLFGGDDNVDERLRHGPWGWMLERATGLKLTQAPRATHAGGRRLDDFRTKGLAVGPGWTLPGGGDHRLHGRTLRWQ